MMKSRTWKTVVCGGDWSELDMRNASYKRAIGQLSEFQL